MSHGAMCLGGPHHGKLWAVERRHGGRFEVAWYPRPGPLVSDRELPEAVNITVRRGHYDLHRDLGWQQGVAYWIWHELPVAQAEFLVPKSGDELATYDVNFAYHVTERALRRDAAHNCVMWESSAEKEAWKIVSKVLGKPAE